MAKTDERDLTKAEQKRKAIYEKQKSEYETDGYEFKDLTINSLKANIMGIVFALPPIILLLVLYFKVNPDFNIFSTGQSPFTFVLALYLVLGIVAHELIHGAFFAIFAKRKWKSISFGFIVKYFTPYCTCNEPIAKIGYAVAILMPTIILGFIPAIISILIESWYLALFGCLMIIGGGVDMYFAVKILKYNTSGVEAQFLDHPYKVGAVIFEKATRNRQSSKSTRVNSEF